jgi:hypothetical protein
MRDEEMMAEIEDFLEGFNQPLAVACDQWGTGASLAEPARLEWDGNDPAASHHGSKTEGAPEGALSVLKEPRQ